MRRELLLLSLCFVLYIASASAPLSFRRCDGCTSEGVENQLQPEAAVDGFQVLWQRRLLQQVQTTKLTLDSRTCTFFALAAFGFFLASGAGVGGMRSSGLWVKCCSSDWTDLTEVDRSLLWSCRRGGC